MLKSNAKQKTMKYLINLIAFLCLTIILAQEKDMVPNDMSPRKAFFDDLQYQRVPELIVDSWNKFGGKTTNRTIYDDPFLRSPKKSVHYVYNLKVKNGYLHINQTIEKTMNSDDMRKVEYFINDKIVNDYKSVKKLFKLRKDDILSLKIDTSQSLESVKVNIYIY